MPLLVSNRPIDLPSSTGDFIERYSQLKETAKSLQSKPVRKIDRKGLLYIHQREFAATTPQDGYSMGDLLQIQSSVSILGTEDATTCHMVVLRHSEAFNCQPENIHLETYCLTELNDVVKQNIHWPVIYGIAVNVKTGDIFRATFPDRGPDEIIRAARTFLEGSIMSVYNAKEEQLQIEPYQWKQFTAAPFWLQQTDQVILQNFSTSPLVEPSHFVKHERSIFQFLSHYPEEPLFPKGRSRIYKKTADGLWERIDCAA
ncbi:protein N-terminal asparagine amidohydrolase isoform X3 [Chiloscyllium plagiosum]|uniref:protein N-terminal asparagine amidohydrolase isoform X3 n=1 Tax=Chiloscyllium plagiosum TaxID=36176 RepID=UPI001CB88247|nr:protein N-terminal asparagine amidohydrolase isoform X3 [Chiloscyllium plagiosum]